MPATPFSRREILKAAFALVQLRRGTRVHELAQVSRTCPALGSPCRGTTSLLLRQFSWRVGALAAALLFCYH